jgi:arylsulfatase A-like enzyme
MARRPDIVLMVLDTQRADRLSCYGCAQPTTPHLDKLASQATLFRHAFSPAQWTIPSHASMFTGVYPSMHGTVQSFLRLPDTLPTLAERLRDSGYFTSAFCNNPLVGIINNGLRRGFYSFLNYNGVFLSRPHQSGEQRGLLDSYRQWFNNFLAEIWDESQARSTARTYQQSFKNMVVEVLSRMQNVFVRSETQAFLSFTPLMVSIWQTALSFKGNSVRTLNDAAKFLTERRGIPRDQPVFSFINLMGAHMPYHPPRRFIERFVPQVLRDRQAKHYLRQFNADVHGWYTPLTSAMDAERKAILDGIYNAEVAYQDELVGQFIRQLEESGRLDNTMLIVCADHGDHLGEKQLIGHIFSSYNELVRVPLLIRAPDGDFSRIGKEVDHFVSTRRIYHTLLDTAGIASDEEHNLSLAQSRKSDPDQGTVFVESIPSQQAISMIRKREPHLINVYNCDQNRSAVCSERYKLIQTGNERPQLYDVLSDPYENLDLHDILPEQVELLQQRLDGFVQQSSAATAACKVQYADGKGGFDDPKVQRRLRDLGYLE